MAMPFHSTETQDEALDLIVLYCNLGRDGNYRIPVYWPEDDILAAMKYAREYFHLENP